MDTSVRALTNGKLREQSEWEALIAAADARFKIEQIVTPRGSALGFIQIVWKST